VTRTEAFAVDDPHTPKVTVERVRKERSNGLLGFGDSETVQVDFPLDLVLTTAELAQDDLLNPLAGEHQFFAARELRVTNVGVQALLQYCIPIGSGEARHRTRAPGWLYRRSVVS
jgi:hypothetical protein